MKPNVVFSTVHVRLERQRGAASLYVCAECSVALAHDWAFDEPTGFSTDLYRYRPLCRRCHMTVDGRIEQVHMKRRPDCGRWMPQAKTTCHSPVGHAGGCRTEREYRPAATR